MVARGRRRAADGADVPRWSGKPDMARSTPICSPRAVVDHQTTDEQGIGYGS
jgi:hypothetical protein